MIAVIVSLNGVEFEVNAPSIPGNAERVDFNAAVDNALAAARVQYPLDEIEFASLELSVRRAVTDVASRDGDGVETNRFPGRPEHSEDESGRVPEADEHPEVPSDEDFSPDIDPDELSDEELEKATAPDELPDAGDSNSRQERDERAGRNAEDLGGDDPDRN